MMSIVFHILWLFFDGKSLKQYSELWKFHWKPRQTRVQFWQNSFVRFFWTHFNLDFQTEIQQYDILFFSEHVIQWKHVIIFFFKYVRRLRIVNAFQQHLHIEWNIDSALNEQNRLLRHFQKLLSQSVDLLNNSTKTNHALRALNRNTFCVKSELILQFYVQTVWKILMKRIIEFHQQCWNINETDFFNFLILDERQGLNGLLYNTIEWIFDHFFRIVNVRLKLNLIRKFNNDNSVLINFIFSNLSGFYNYTRSDVWRDKLWNLFIWNDELELKSRAWKNESFRQLIKQLYHVVEQEFFKIMTDDFLQVMINCVVIQLNIIFQYDANKLFIMFKTFKNHAVNTQQKIRNMIELQRTNWIISYLFKNEMNVIENLQTQIQHTQISEIRHIWKQTLMMFYNSFIIHIHRLIFCVDVEINVLLTEIFIDFKIKYYVNKIFSYVKQFLQELVNRNAINKHSDFDSTTEQIDFDTSIAFNIADSDGFDEDVAF